MQCLLVGRQSRIRSLNPPSLALSHFPPPSSPSLDPPPPTISHVLSLLLPTFVTLPLSLELLNTTPFVPESSEEDLSSGVLQLSNGTTLLITETNVREGQLVEKGAIQAYYFSTNERHPLRRSYERHGYPRRYGVPDPLLQISLQSIFLPD